MSAPPNDLPSDSPPDLTLLLVEALILGLATTDGEAKAKMVKILHGLAESLMDSGQDALATRVRHLCWKVLAVETEAQFVG